MMSRSPISTIIIAVLLFLNLGYVNAFWRLLCYGSVGLARIDPLMNPGELSEHVHSIKGGSAFSPTSTSADLLKSKCASCSVAQDKSVYWTPAVYFMSPDGSVEIVPEKPPHKTYYSLNTGLTYDGKPQKIEAFPEGFQMISGSNYNRNCSLPDPDPNPLGPWTDEPQDLRAQRAIGFNCLNYARGFNEPSLMRHEMPDKAYLDANCADGIRLELMFPSCWNGEKDGRMHKSHVAFPDGVITGNCPQGYDRRLASLFYETIIATDAFKGKDGQFVISNGDIKGNGYHGDFISAWEPGVLQQAIDTCTSLSGDQEACEIFEFPPNTGSCTLENPLPVEIANEDVKGPRKGLPGGLNIQYGPEPAKKKEGQQPAAVAQPSTAALPSSSIAKAPVLPLSSNAAAAESTHLANSQESGGVFAQVDNYHTASLQQKVAVGVPVTHTSPPATTPPPAGSAPAALEELTIATSYTTIGREVIENVQVQVDVTVTASASKPTGAHHKRRHTHHAAHGRGIDDRRLR